MTALDLVFWGTPQIAVPALRAVVAAGHQVKLVVSQPDRPAGRGRKVAPGPVASAARELGLKLIQPQRPQQALEQIAAAGALAACLMAYGCLLGPALLELWPLGAINVHTSLLPLLRGAAPINHAILQGLGQSGVSTMFMDQGLDTGDVILQRATPLGPQETAASLAQRLAELGAELLVETLDLLAQGQAPRIPQDDTQATQAPRLSKADGLLDLSLSAIELDRRVRGLDPWPGAYTLLEGQPLKLFAPTRVISPAPPAPPGTILPELAQAGEMVLACGQGALAVGQVQAPGKRRLPAGQFLCGARLEPGLVLGR